MDKLFANSEDPDQTPQNAVSDLGLHCLPITLLGVSQLQRVKVDGPQMCCSQTKMIRLYRKMTIYGHFFFII